MRREYNEGSDDPEPNSMCSFVRLFDKKKMKHYEEHPSTDIMKKSMSILNILNFSPPIRRNSHTTPQLQQLFLRTE